LGIKKDSKDENKEIWEKQIFLIKKNRECLTDLTKPDGSIMFLSIMFLSIMFLSIMFLSI